MKNLHRITIFYLTFPFIIFCMGWLKLPIAIPVTAVILWALWLLLKQAPNLDSRFPDPKSTFYLLLLTGIWVFLSGIGGYTFQNWDHHWRNAVLHDLITYSWPVIYSSPDKGPITMLVYYVGYFLPAALTGKLLGWQAANFVLFLWTWLGVFLTVLHLNIKFKTSVFKTALLLIFFSGLDALGAVFFAKEYPTLWPPIQHLEIWSGNLQYSSFTTQLFWVFNQAVPAWLCIALILESDSLLSDRQEQAPALQKPSQKIFLWSLCFFFAPLAALGLLPYLLIEWFKRTDFKFPFKNLRVDLLLASGIIVLISYLYFSSNTAAQERGFQAIALKDFLAFFLLEGGILWLVLAPLKWRDPRWAFTGLLLVVIPFIQFGSGRDFVMRASIAPLFYLMIMTGEAIFQKTTPRLLLITLYLLLVLGSLTPLYEINRSIYRSYEYYFVLDPSQRAQPTSEVVTHLEQPGAPENEHPNMLVADEIKTLKFMNDKLSKNFVANVRQSLYYRYLSSHSTKVCFVAKNKNAPRNDIKKDNPMSQLIFPPDQQAFASQVWEIVRQIPRGRVASYGQIAKILPIPAGVDGDTYLEFGALWVSGAVASCPDDVPWQRVVNSKGEVSEKNGADARRHKLMLEEEDIIFGVRGRIDMKKYGWNGKIKSE